MNGVSSVSKQQAHVNLALAVKAELQSAYPNLTRFPAFRFCERVLKESVAEFEGAADTGTSAGGGGGDGDDHDPSGGTVATQRWSSDVKTALETLSSDKKGEGGVKKE
jgi:hypothetical protein